MQRSRVLLLSAYDAISHRLWAARCQEMLSEVEWTTLSARPRHFAWALRGRPLQWFLDPQQQSTLQGNYDALIATSTVDLAALFACAPGLAQVPSLLFMHENQFVYPVNQSVDQALRRAHRVDACMVQIYALLAATRVVFNSAFHRNSMHQGVQTFLSRMPEKMDATRLLDKIAQAPVLSVPIEDAAFGDPQPLVKDGPLRIVWNHRWEFDKAPQRFLRALDLLSERGVQFQLILLGEAFGQRHEALAQLKSRHGDRILHEGMVPERSDYYEVLRRGQVLVSTALHDFQGLSMLEGAASGLFPLAPRRLAYPEIYPESCLYASSPEDPQQEAQDLCQALVDLDERRKAGKLDTRSSVQAARAFSCAGLQASYRSTLQTLLSTR